MYTNFIYFTPWYDALWRRAIVEYPAFSCIGHRRPKISRASGWFHLTKQTEIKIQFQYTAIPWTWQGRQIIRGVLTGWSSNPTNLISGLNWQSTLSTQKVQIPSSWSDQNVKTRVKINQSNHPTTTYLENRSKASSLSCSLIFPNFNVQKECWTKYVHNDLLWKNWYIDAICCELEGGE